jgi:sialate O-acetylesterase
MPIRMTAFNLLIISLLLPQISFADIRLPKLVASGMVLQRDTEVKIWGWADPQEKITLQFDKKQFSVSADAHGNWSILLAPVAAGGPHTMTLQGNNILVLDDIVFGDVWLASGQSNMELTLARAEPRFADLVPKIHNVLIRQFEVPDRFNFKEPLQDLEGGKWVPATQEHIRAFSAIGYFFADAIQSSKKVPVGIINAALGGSPVEAWISENTLKKFPDAYTEGLRFRDDKLIEEITQSDQTRMNAWFSELNQNDAGFKQDQYLWAEPELDTSSWQTFQVPGYWPESEQGPVNGVFWFRKTVDVPKTQAGQEALLLLGTLVDADQVFVNGTQVGSTGYMYPPRRYKVPAGLIKAGANMITVRLTSQSGRGGFVPDKVYALQFADLNLDLKGPWLYQQGATMPPLGSQTFIRWKPMGLFNGEIAPLLNYRIKGVIWYQGESNAGNATAYRERFPELIQDWRQHWDQGDFPFLYVQLANYLPPGAPADDTGWALTREAQLQTLKVPNTAMVVSADVGEWNDIHPLDKKTVGERLAAAALNLAYGNKNVHSGPLFKSAKIQGNKMVLDFEHAGSGLVAKDGKLLGFTIAGVDGKFHEAQAKIKRNSVVVWSKAVKAPKAVRYAWANSPEILSLYNKEGFPASPFRTDSW